MIEGKQQRNAGESKKIRKRPNVIIQREIESEREKKKNDFLHQD